MAGNKFHGVCMMMPRYLCRRFLSVCSTQPQQNGTEEQTLLDANDELGRVWLPPGRHVLGAEAARFLRPHLLGAAVRPHDRRLGLPFLG